MIEELNASRGVGTKPLEDIFGTLRSQYFPPQRLYKAVKGHLTTSYRFILLSYSNMETSCMSVYATDQSVTAGPRCPPNLCKASRENGPRYTP